MDPSTPIPYTSNPLLLVLNDLWLFAQITITWPITAGLPSIILPLSPTRSGGLDELALTPKNAWASVLHVFLIVLQTVFLVSLVPLAYMLLPVLYFAYIIAFVLGNQAFTVLLNGWRKHGLFVSHPRCVAGKPVHEHEKWVFINGVAVGSHWLQANLDRLAMTFRRPVYGIHNQTRGIIFDVLECIIQRDLNYATTDIRQSYAALVRILADDNVHKAVLIVHSQGAIEGGLVLDWLYASVSAAQLRKLEVYTFGNAANHWNAPLVSMLGENGNGSGTPGPDGQTRIVKYIEHYANTGDYVSRFGILHFRPDQSRLRQPNSATTVLTGITSPPSNPPSKAVPNGRNPLRVTTAAPPSTSKSASTPKTPIERLDPAAEDHNRFIGRLFKRVGSGHQFNQHYLDNVFEMEEMHASDRALGRVSDGNAFMDAQVDLAVFENWDTVQVQVPSPGQGVGGGPRRRVQVKELSRLWGYRNGGDPDRPGRE